MSIRTTVRALVSAGSLALMAIAACSTGNNASPSKTSTSTGSGAGNGSTGSQSPSDAGSTDGAGGLRPLLIDNMDLSPDAGTQIPLVVPAGDKPGTYYAYSDQYSTVEGTDPVTGLVYHLGDTPVSPSIQNSDGTTITGELCLQGSVLEYVGLGLSLVYGSAGTPVPFNASAYNGASFYIWVAPSDGGTLPSIHFGIPDTQTADPEAWPQTACAMGDAGKCDDDFGSDVTFTPGMWTKNSFSWNPANGNLAQEGWGTPFDALKTSALIGMKWQANGTTQDAGYESFTFCISDLYFTP